MNGLITLLLKRGTAIFRVLGALALAAWATPASALSLYSRIHHRNASEDSAEDCRAMQYLAVVGVVPLRYAPPPAVATPRPPKADPAPASIATKSNPAPTQSAEKSEPSPATAKAKAEPEKTSVPADGAPVSILPDDTPRDVHAEDVLPYFQMPKGDRVTSGAPLPFTPASPGLPASSATYELK